mmetsp:Transcript_37845/g.56512  ORF Transcript_37845/g.56512 Transcript_37845/m.56512 type:complete len:254 (-) Transcript_37845:496-1257(-)
MMVALAVPPPSQMAKSPYLPCCLSNSWTRVVISFTPVAPRGCPKAIAPPLTLNLSKLPPKNVFATAKGTGAKASFTSTTAMSSGLRLAFLRAAPVAGTGPSSMIVGSEPTTDIATNLALGFRPNFLSPASLQTRMAAEPSQIWLLVAGVRIPLGNMGFKDATFSYVVARIPSSATCISFGESPFDNFTGMGRISFLNLPALVASAPRRWLSTANLSSSSLLQLYFRAKSSAPPNWLKLRVSNPNSSSCFMLSP